MTKVLMIEYEKCVSCRTCEMACSAKHLGAVNRFQSRISVIKWGMEGEGIPIACSHCESAPCQAICPVTAITREQPLGRVTVDHDKCIGCRMCVAVCPFGAITFDSASGKIANAICVTGILSASGFAPTRLCDTSMSASRRSPSEETPQRRSRVS